MILSPISDTFEDAPENAWEQVDGTGADEEGVGAPTGLLTLLTAHEEASIENAVRQAYAPNTLAAYSSAMRGYRSWCLLQSKSVENAAIFDAVQVTLFLVSLGERGSAPSSIEIARSAILYYADQVGLGEPLRASAGMRRALAGVRREARRSHISSQAPAFSREQLKALVEHSGTDLRALRDRCYLLLSAAVGLRASDVCWVTVGACEFIPGQGMILTLAHSKTSDLPVALPIASLPEEHAALDPVLATEAYLHALRTLGEDVSPTSPLLRPIRRGGWSASSEPLSPDALGGILRAMAKAAGVEGHWSSHSLRSTYATCALRAGVSEATVQRDGRWSSAEMVRLYQRRTSLFSEPASSWLGME